MIVTFIVALAVGIALAGAAYWSWEVLVVVRHLQNDVCILDDQVRANSARLNHMPVPPARQLQGCGTP
jgi:hypothetical protein